VRPFRWTELRDISRDKGFSFDRYRGSHYVMTKRGERLDLSSFQCGTNYRQISF